MVTVTIKKPGTLATTLQKPAEEANIYVQFGYGLLKICNTNQLQVSGYMNADPMNITQTS